MKKIVSFWNHRNMCVTLVYYMDEKDDMGGGKYKTINYRDPTFHSESYNQGFLDFQNFSGK